MLTAGGAAWRLGADALSCLPVLAISFTRLIVFLPPLLSLLHATTNGNPLHTVRPHYHTIPNGDKYKQTQTLLINLYPPLRVDLRQNAKTYEDTAK